MQTGWLWVVADASRDLQAKVLRAAVEYEAKFGQAPNTCFVHPSALNGKRRARVNGIAVRPRTETLRHHFWLGVAEKRKR